MALDCPSVAEEAALPVKAPAVMMPPVWLMAPAETRDTFPAPPFTGPFKIMSLLVDTT